jgi:G3E family GTPase
MRSARPLPSSPSALDTRTAVTVLTGFSPAATATVARVLLVTDPALLQVAYDHVGDGVVRRRIRTATTVVEDADVPLDEDCVSCLVRADVLPVLTRLSRERPGADIVLALPAALDPETLAAACAHSAEVTDALRFDSYLAVVDAGRIAADLASTDTLHERWPVVPATDGRTVADVVVRQIEYADTVLRWESPTLDRYEAAQLSVLLHRLAPWATHVSAGGSNRVDCTDLAARIRHTRRHDPTVPGILGRALEGFPIGAHEPDSDCGVASTVFSARRPFHPRRLHDALTALPDGVLRGRGQFWIASRPDTVIGYEHAGGTTTLDDLGHWLAALPQHRWAEATTHRRLTADLDWDPYYGDRRTALAFIGVDLDATAITERLTGCLLTDAETADGEDAWRAYPDPFPT